MSVDPNQDPCMQVGLDLCHTFLDDCPPCKMRHAVGSCVLVSGGLVSDSFGWHRSRGIIAKAVDHAPKHARINDFFTYTLRADCKSGALLMHSGLELNLICVQLDMRDLCETCLPSVSLDMLPVSQLFTACKSCFTERACCQQIRKDAFHDYEYDYDYNCNCAQQR
jgi:hypothetical protein